MEHRKVMKVNRIDVNKVGTRDIFKMTIVNCSGLIFKIDVHVSGAAETRNSFMLCVCVCV